MRLVNRRLMLQMPISTVYSMWIPNSYVELFVFTGLRGTEDWEAIKLVDGVKTAFFLDPVFVKSVPRFTPAPGDTRSQLYLIWDEADIQRMLGRMQAALASVPNQAHVFLGD
jgi:hypothetical protein